jgi:hypothetical protein
MDRSLGKPLVQQGNPGNIPFDTASDHGNKLCISDRQKSSFLCEYYPLPKTIQLHPRLCYSFVQTTLVK